ncbi:hypothetical protein CPB84DRAFT_1760709 [Gymnopilus junonius]|uniref:F-box domain-containing protein n=1 Tax=Gymnopilus junonius TaxID=109634 RepID=A0A9P5TUK3_GYMJU|nr:hypothetical protein CPB84DRAFT_1760709 [Gymnopilus junonius]
MPFKVSELVHAAYRRLFDRSKRKDNRCFFLRLDPDILVNDIFPYLLVEELISLRQVNSALFLLTHEPVIWKRYLNSITFPVSPLRPTFNPADPAANFEFEAMVTSACALYRSWAVGRPKIMSENILVAHNKIVDLKLLPGGKFLVASVKDRDNFHFFIHVYAMDVMYGSRLVARLPTYFKVYDLQAKYMDYQGKPGIMISYTRRRFENGVPQNLRNDLNNLYHKAYFDDYHPLVYEAFCIHMPLDAVEALIRPDLVPVNDEYLRTARSMSLPFVQVFTHQTADEIHSPTIFEDEGRPCMAFAEDKSGKSVLRIVALDNRFGSTLDCLDHPGHLGKPHRIRAIRYLPCERGMLVIRSISSEPQAKEMLTFEIYHFPGLRNPEMDEVQFKMVDGPALLRDSWDCELDGKKLQGEVVISDPVPPTNVAPNYPGLHIDNRPPTLWIFAPCEKPRGCAYWWLRAEPVDQTQREWRYTQTNTRSRCHINRKRRYERALPGSERTLYLELDDENISEASILSKIRRFYWNTDRFPNQYPFTVPTASVSVPVTCPQREELGINAFMSAENTVLMDVQKTKDMRKAVNRLGGLIAITWDEYSGKICLAAEQEDKIRVYDMAPIAEPHRKLAYRSQAHLLGLTPGSIDFSLAHNGLFGKQSSFF